MIQKTYRITEYSVEKLESILNEVASLPAFQSASQVLLIVMEQNWNVNGIQDKIRIVKDKLPKVEIAGITHFDAVFPSEVKENAILSFLFFEHVAFEIKKIDLGDKSDLEAREALKEGIETYEDPKAIMLFTQKNHRNISSILEKVEVPVFGADAAVSNFIGDGGSSYVFDEDGCHTETLLLVVFFGKDLHVKVSYNLGWIPVGKTFTITGMKDDFNVTTIDGRPAAEIYEKYLGIPYQTNSLSVLNICEFPLIVHRNGLQMARIPFEWTRDGELKFMVDLSIGEQIRLSYGLPKQIFEQIYDDADEYRLFAPQAMFMVICMNRMLFLQEKEKLEIDAYKAVAEELAYLHGNAEIYWDGKAGGEMHSALIAVGFREGDVKDIQPEDECTMSTGDQLIPLEQRLMTFIRAVTSDLEQTTNELLDLKDHLEDEVERKTRENESLSYHVVQTLAAAIDAKDSYTNGHSDRVAKYSREIARRAGYSVKQQNDIYMMGLLHDVGKIGVPDAVINKPGKLTDEEFAIIKTHPVQGSKILKTIEEMPQLEAGARYHHERFDGRGYPDGLSGYDIPEEARIIAVADAYDAMTSNRSYRKGMDQARVRDQIVKGIGTQFDPRFAEIMIQMIDEDKDFTMKE